MNVSAFISSHLQSADSHWPNPTGRASAGSPSDAVLTAQPAGHSTGWRRMESGPEGVNQDVQHSRTTSILLNPESLMYSSVRNTE